MVLALQPTAEEAAALERTGSPVVVVGGVRARTGRASASTTSRPPPTPPSTSSTSGTSGSRTSAAYPTLSTRAWTFSAPSDRVRGYRQTMAAAGLAVDPDWVVTGDFTARAGLAACRTLLEAHHRPTAIFAGSDEMAFGAAQAVREAGLRVPEDISLVGVDDHELSEFFDLTHRRPARRRARPPRGPAPARRPRRPCPRPTRHHRAHPAGGAREHRGSGGGECRNTRLTGYPWS